MAWHSGVRSHIARGKGLGIGNGWLDLVPHLLPSTPFGFFSPFCFLILLSYTYQICIQTNSWIWDRGLLSTDVYPYKPNWRKGKAGEGGVVHDYLSIQGFPVLLTAA